MDYITGPVKGFTRITYIQTPCMPGITAPILLLHNHNIMVQVQPHTNKQQN